MVSLLLSPTVLLDPMELPQEWEQVENDWYNKPILPIHQYRLLVDPTQIWFSAKRAISPHCDRNHTTGQFVEGLWTSELAELFICDAEGPRYQEFNLAPTGAWWSCVFSTYRVRETEHGVNVQGVRTFSEIKANAWEASICIPRTALGVQLLDPTSARMNITFVTLQPKEAYLCAQALNNSQPDFHLTDQFPTLSTKYI